MGQFTAKCHPLIAPARAKLRHEYMWPHPSYVDEKDVEAPHYMDCYSRQNWREVEDEYDRTWHRQ